MSNPLTIFLCSGWNYLWASIYNLGFDDKEICRGNEISGTRFLNFVDCLLILCPSKAIHNFSIICFCLQEAVRRFTLSVHIRSKHSRLRASLRLPPSILTSKTLVKLRLCNDIYIYIFKPVFVLSFNFSLFSFFNPPSCVLCGAKLLAN